MDIKEEGTIIKGKRNKEKKKKSQNTTNNPILWTTTNTNPLNKSPKPVLKKTKKKIDLTTCLIT